MSEEKTFEANKNPRFVNLTSHPVNSNLATLLEKGPKFALTQQVTPSTLHTVEAGIERAFYGLKWSYTLEKLKNRTAPAQDEEAATNNLPPHPQSQPTPTTEDIDSSAANNTIPRPFFQDSGAGQPPNIPKEGEEVLEKIKSKILNLYRGIRKNSLQISPTSRKKELNTLKQDKDKIVKRSDNCKSLVIMERSDYISKSESIVSTYDIKEKNHTAKLEEDTKTLMKKTLKNKIPDNHLQRLPFLREMTTFLPQHARTAEFYGLPKTHKVCNPLRPIVSACGDPLDKLSWFLRCILTQLLSFIPAHLTNTQSYLTRMKDTFPDGLPPKA